MYKRYPILFRWIILSLTLTAVAIIAQFYFISPLYHSEFANLPPTAPTPLGVLLTLGVAALFIGSKYLVYDVLFSLLRQRTPLYILTVIFYTAYVLGAAIDCVAFVASQQPMVDAGFAIFATVIYSPPLLIGALVVGLIVRAASRHTRMNG